MGKGGGPSDVSDEEILEFLADTAPPAVSSTEIADAVGMSASGVKIRLEKLRDRGLVNDHATGASRIWWLTDADEDRVQSSS
jgi:predicted ArsR family transcriptional regulator